MFFHSFQGTALLALWVASSTASPVVPEATLPIVDLGYVKQQASAYNATGGYYYFNNIAFAQPPLGDLRWAAPKPPAFTKGVKNGRFPSPQCPQATPAWLNGTTPNTPEGPADPSESEDCLYLDVIVPEKIFQNRRNASAPVLTWIYGGGNVVGSKQGFGPGSGLVERSMQTTNSDGVIFVAMNYRLGAFAYFGGSEYVSQGGTPNLALLDQKLALEWIQQNVGKFGGDVGKVTVMGESGGAGAIGHHLTAPQNKNGPPFQQAVFQSPADFPEVPTDAYLNAQFAQFLKAVNVSCLDEARALDSATLQNWNRKYNYNSPAGRFRFLLSVDNEYVVDSVYQGLAAGRFDPSVKILTAHNSQEGVIFTPNLKNFNFRKYVQSYVTRASKTTIDHIVNDLYPSSSFQNTAARANAFFGDILIDCLHYSIQRAFDRQGPAYLFAVPPGYHVEDLPYTFYGNGIPVDLGYGLANSTVAIDMQTYLVNFAAHGDPNADGQSNMLPTYGEAGNMLQLTSQSEYSVVPDPSNNQRCEFWATYK